jgi:hypothetical protein
MPSHLHPIRIDNFIPGSIDVVSFNNLYLWVDTVLRAIVQYLLYFGNSFLINLAKCLAIVL